MSKKKDLLKVIVVITICINLILVSLILGSIYIKNNSEIVSPKNTIKNTKINSNDILRRNSQVAISSNQNSINSIKNQQYQIKGDDNIIYDDLENEIVTKSGDDKIVSSVTIDDSIRIGDENAKVKIIWFVDYTSPYVKKFYNGIFLDIKEKFIDTGEVAFYIKNYPQESIHKNSRDLSKSAICLNEQGLSNRFIDDYFKSYINYENIDMYYEDLDLEKYNKCLVDSNTNYIIQKDLTEGYNLNVKNVPEFLIDNKRISGIEPFFVWNKLISRELNNN